MRSQDYVSENSSSYNVLGIIVEKDTVSRHSGRWLLSASRSGQGVSSSTSSALLTHVHVLGFLQKREEVSPHLIRRAEEFVKRVSSVLLAWLGMTKRRRTRSSSNIFPR